MEYSVVEKTRLTVEWIIVEIPNTLNTVVAQVRQ